MSIIRDYYTIRLHDTDAAGIIFFNTQFRIVHDLYEKMMTQIGFSFHDRFEKKDFYIPIVHAEADFSQPLRVGDVVEMSLEVERVGNSSFALAYRLTDLDGTTVGTARTVHVTADPKTMKKIPLPAGLRRKLEELARPE